MTGLALQVPHEPFLALETVEQAGLEKRLGERKISLERTEAARRLVARRGFDPVYGARPLKRYLQHELETRLGRAIIGGEVLEGAKLTVEITNPPEEEAREVTEVPSEEETPEEPGVPEEGVPVGV